MLIETIMVKRNVAFVSLFYLPYAVRVLGAWMVEPKWFLVLIPASICAYFATQPDAALELMRFLQIDSYPKSTCVIGWQTLVFAGLFSSIINFFFSTLFLEGRFRLRILLIY